MQIFEKSGQFNPADWGLKAGDMLQVVVVGGGGGGGAGDSYNRHNLGANGGDAGKAGNKTPSDGLASAPGGAGGGYGSGGGGGQGYSTTGTNYKRGGGGGAGGEIVTATYKLKSTGPINVVVGAAGKGGIAGESPISATKGGDSSFDTIVAAGGNPGKSGNEDGTGGESSFAPGGNGSTNTSQTTKYGLGGGGGGGYIIGMPLIGGRGGDADVAYDETGASPGTFNGGVSGGIKRAYPRAGSMGAPSGLSGGPGHGVVVVCW